MAWKVINFVIGGCRNERGLNNSGSLKGLIPYCRIYEKHEAIP